MMTFAWWVAMCVCVLLYIALDGSDLGAGIFSLFVRDEHERGAIMASMSGTWDMNETWLVVAGGILFATFPAVYGSAFAFLMLPLAFALWGIMTRAVSLEYRHLAHRTKRFTDLAFGLSSLGVTFFGGMAVGAVLQGYKQTQEPGRLPAFSGGAVRLHHALEHLDRRGVGRGGHRGGRALRPGPLREGRADPPAGRALDADHVLGRPGDGRHHAGLERRDLPLGARPSGSAATSGSGRFSCSSRSSPSSGCCARPSRIGMSPRSSGTSPRAVVMGVAMMATMYPWLVPNT